jgi:hypothetical protein
LTGSGDLRLISDDNLKNALADYFTTIDVVILVQKTHELELVQTFQPYIIDNMEYRQVYYQWLEDCGLPPTSSNDEILKVISTRTFRNVIVQKWSISNDLLDQLKQTKIKIQHILSILDTQMETTS